MFCEINLGCKFPIILVLTGTLDLMDSSIIMVHFFILFFFFISNQFRPYSSSSIGIRKHVYEFCLGSLKRVERENL